MDCHPFDGFFDIKNSPHHPEMLSEQNHSGSPNRSSRTITENCEDNSNSGNMNILSALGGSKGYQFPQSRSNFNINNLMNDEDGYIEDQNSGSPRVDDGVNMRVQSPNRANNSIHSNSNSALASPKGVNNNNKMTNGARGSSQEVDGTIILKNSEENIDSVTSPTNDGSNQRFSHVRRPRYYNNNNNNYDGYLRVPQMQNAGPQNYHYPPPPQQGRNYRYYGDPRGFQNNNYRRANNAGQQQNPNYLGYMIPPQYYMNMVYPQMAPVPGNTYGMPPQQLMPSPMFYNEGINWYHNNYQEHFPRSNNNNQSATQPFLFTPEKRSYYECMDPSHLNRRSIQVYTLTGLKNYMVQETSVKKITEEKVGTTNGDSKEIESGSNSKKSSSVLCDTDVEGYLIITSTSGECDMNTISKMLSNDPIEKIMEEPLTFCLFDKLDDDKTFGKIILKNEVSEIDDSQRNAAETVLSAEDGVEGKDKDNKNGSDDGKAERRSMIYNLIKLCKEEVLLKNYQLSASNITITTPILITGLIWKYVEKTESSFNFVASAGPQSLFIQFIKPISEICKDTKIVMGIITHKEGLYIDPENKRMPFYRFNIKDHTGIITVIIRGPHAPGMYDKFNKEDVVIIRNAFVQDYNFKYKLCRSVDNPLCLYIEKDTIVTTIGELEN